MYCKNKVISDNTAMTETKHSVLSGSRELKPSRVCESLNILIFETMGTLSIHCGNHEDMTCLVSRQISSELNDCGIGFDQLALDFHCSLGYSGGPCISHLGLQ